MSEAIDAGGLRKRPQKDAAASGGAKLSNGVDIKPEVDFKDSKVKPQKAAAAATHAPRRIGSGVRVLPANTLQWTVLITLTAAALFTRLYRISLADYVVWDEAHFGKFAGHYLKRTFYFDVHPPLGKMLNGLAGYVAGFNGTFEFKSGEKYPPELNYSVMRIANALFGVGMVPLAYLTAIQLHLSEPACILMGVMVLGDVALAVISRFILLDSMLLFFTVQSVFCLAVFRNQQQTAPFTLEWYAWLFATGISLGAVASVKWVGLFAIALVGLHTIDELWEMLGDLKMPPTRYAHHWLARIAGLIVAPIAVYVLSFAVHFAVLNRSGPGDAQMSSLFQAGLEGNNFHENPLELAYGSKITLKNNGRGGGLLHSHVQRYPTGSEQQQVTCYHHKDSNNHWIVRKAWKQTEDPEKVEFVKDGDVLRLVHASTGRNLHSHNVKAPVTTAQNEVSCYGNATIGDSNDLWKLERVDDLLDAKSEGIRSLTTRFRLRHHLSGCLLRSHAVTLPQWGFKQAEVVCQKKGDDASKNHWWNIEQHSHDKLPPGGKKAFHSKFLHDFTTLNVAMWTSNNALTPDPDKEPDALTSQPYQWPLLLVGLRMCGWGDDKIKYWLVGNPVVWWGSTASLLVGVGLGAVYAVRSKRGYVNFATRADQAAFVFTAKIGLLGWALHYLPFFLMGRVTYLHHYFPALYFAIITCVATLDHLAARVCGRGTMAHVAVLLGVGVGVLANFVYFGDFVWGFEGPAERYRGRKWVASWNVVND
ncbi:Dolichyl-phosphate-mannose-protein mannosyltransferase-domain-containing protein [Fimicolochytrium jonesii]|uniref:Dolichyl-phosphate-mannose-protein mannosyltransferase-domain-containing protein n=1 Tax=Fimicolochytrium jonesii TaxID=1396493 RepID=UPI0022FE7273|nr:Dolichyl-phosphate-mannose-protein mannosyltransferase-domain-containing protein [Fimicolochytrium jonesii]KAI8815781.1 Dolichyl-phosphate-mannose-protein mannosyltransferase-domain-containing protein [Fimicolochytrium jonesii]